MLTLVIAGNGVNGISVRRNNRLHVQLLSTYFFAGMFELYIAVPFQGSFIDIDISLRFTWMQCCLTDHYRVMKIYNEGDFKKVSYQQQLTLFSSPNSAFKYRTEGVV